MNDDQVRVPMGIRSLNEITSSLGLTRRIGRHVLPLLLGILAAWPIGSAAEERLEQIISREDVRFNCGNAGFTIGRDGMVYLCSGGNNSFVLRMTRDGRDKFGQAIVYAAKNATANADGVVASANAHFAAQVAIYDRALQKVTELKEFLVNDAVGWEAPAGVEVGASGDFYGLDQHRDRIVRLSPAGKLLAVYTLPHDPPAPNGAMDDFRVCEKKKFFVVMVRGAGLRAIGFDGTAKWTRPASLAGLAGLPFDVDDDGTLHYVEANSPILKRVGADGQPMPDITLQLDNRKPSPGRVWFFNLRVFNHELFIRSEHPTELFQCYDLASGAFKHSVMADHERFTVTYATNVWTAGQPLPFSVTLDGGGRATAPQWRVWARPLAALDYRELKWSGGNLDVPADLAGLYRVKVTPETQPLELGGRSEYLLQSIVEIRPPDSRGALAVLTPDGRQHYGQGETVPCSILLRSPEKDLSVPVALTLEESGKTIARATVTATTNAATSLELPSGFTAGLKPGRYVLAATAAGFTSGRQPLMIGPGTRELPFYTIQYGDYGVLQPTPVGALWTAPDFVAASAERLRKLGITMIVNRLGTAMGELRWENNVSLVVLESLSRRLAADPLAVPPETLKLSAPHLQGMGARTAVGIREMAILMGNDAGLPLGTGYDNRKPDQLVQVITNVTRAVAPYRSFRGWSWASNWWISDKRGGAAAATPEEKAAYEAAVKKALETGTWDPVIDKVAGIRLGYAVEAQDMFNRTLRSVDTAGNLLSAVAAPHRNVEAYPPITFSNVDETDLQAQWEQIGVPYHAPHGVDFYTRPGKRSFAHPEMWNDDGTGGQIVPTIFQTVMRGARGVGFSGALPAWTTIGSSLPDDPRVGHYGYESVYRALNGVLNAYGPFLATLEDDDQVAIAASGRMYKIDDWSGTMGLHFARQFEAYVSCLQAHHPARYVFAEDLKPDTLTRFKAVLLVDERVELEPELTAALQNARTAGVKIFHDGTCKAETVKGFTSLGIRFDKFEKDPSPAGDDGAYARFAAYGESNRVALAAALDAVTPPAAGVEDGGILVSRRKAESGQYVFVVNNTMPKLDPGQIWRMTLSLTTRVPLVTPVKLNDTAGKAVYDVFALTSVSPRDGAVQADLRNLPARLFAVLPSTIERVELSGPKSVRAGQAFAWSVKVKDAAGKPIAAGIPLRLRLLASDRTELSVDHLAAGSQGVSGVLTAPLNAQAGNLILQATELFSGLGAEVAFAVASPDPVLFLTAAPAAGGPPAAAEAAGSPLKPGADMAPADSRFGPHVRDLVIADEGSLAVMNTMNWDHNLYAVDTRTGEVRWRQRVGQYFAFSPRLAGDKLAVQGFDFNSAEGYHLYLVDADGKPQRRFALYGLPKRLPHRFVPAILGDRINNFAASPDGRWVASAGDLGLAMWTGDGKTLWTQDWGRTNRHAALLTALDDKTLLAVEGMDAAAWRAEDGKPLWKRRLAAAGEVRKAMISADGETCVLLATTEGGRLFILRRGEVVRVIPTGCEDAGVSPDGSLVAVADDYQLKVYSVTNGLQWIFTGDSRIRFPSFAPDSKRLVSSSDLGSLYVFDAQGNRLLDRDMGARTVPAWLPQGDLMAATWMGSVVRLDTQYRERWRTLLRPGETDMRDKLLATQEVPTTRVASWSNAEATPAPLQPNVLAGLPCTISFVPSGGWGGVRGFSMDATWLTDGKLQAPTAPWIPWNYVGFFAETSPVNYVRIDTLHTPLRVTGITIAEDPAHPESWLRDAQFEAWDAAREQWIPVQALLSDSVVHTHRFARPVESARFRLLLPWGVVGNLRMSEIVLHGEVLGGSHPDVAAKRPAAGQ
jgi:outer membrane protein assembly factor BamB